MPTFRRQLQVPSKCSPLAIDDAARLLDRYEEVRVIAEAMRHAEPRRQMFKIAETYKRLAQHAYERARRKATQGPQGST